ncbi:MAG: hypothetical protein ACREO5_06785, partial [Candidatus Binatia bacterium]
HAQQAGGAESLRRRFAPASLRRGRIKSREKPIRERPIDQRNHRSLTPARTGKDLRTGLETFWYDWRTRQTYICEARK